MFHLDSTIHKDYSGASVIKSFEDIENKMKSSKVIGIGETGLDFFYNNSDKEVYFSLVSPS